MNSAYNLSKNIENVQNGGKFPLTIEYPLQENQAGRVLSTDLCVFLKKSFIQFVI